MARAAFLMDRLMARVGLSGKSFIPLLSSFACAVPGIMATRVIENERDRLDDDPDRAAADLLGPAAGLRPVDRRLHSGARLLTGGGSLGSSDLQGLTLAGLYLLGIVAAVVFAMLFKRTILRGQTPPFVMELPSYKMPSPRTVLLRMTERGWVFLRCAGTLILAVSILVWAALYYPARSTGQPPATTTRQLPGPRRPGDRAGRAAAGLGLADRLRGARVAAGPRTGRRQARRDVPSER